MYIYITTNAFQNIHIYPHIACVTSSRLTFWVASLQHSRNTTSWSYLQIVLLSRNETPTWNSQAGSLGPGVCFACKVGWSNGGLLAVISSHIPPKITKGGKKSRSKPSFGMSGGVTLPSMIHRYDLDSSARCQYRKAASDDFWCVIELKTNHRTHGKPLSYLYHLSRIYHFCSCITCDPSPSQPQYGKIKRSFFNRSGIWSKLSILDSFQTSPNAKARVDQESPMTCSVGGEICTTLKPLGPK